MLPYKRSDRVGHNLKREISDIIMSRVKDPRIGFVTVTDVQVSPDLRQARVFVSVLKDEERKPTLEALDAAKFFIRSELVKRLHMKIVPHLEFSLDTSPQYADNIDRLLKKLHDEEEGR